MNTESHSLAVDRYPDPSSFHALVSRAVDRLTCPGTATPRPPIDQYHGLFTEIRPATPSNPTPHPPWWCGFLTNRSSYRYQSTHSPAAGHYPDPSFDPGTVSTRRVLSRAVQSYQKFDAPPPPRPMLSTIVPAHPYTRLGPGGAGF